MARIAAAFLKGRIIMLRITIVSLLAGLLALSACTTNEPELPPTDPSTLVTTVNASSRDRNINGLPPRPASTSVEDTISVTGEAGTTADECRNINSSGNSVPQPGNSNRPVDGSAPEDCVRGSVTLGG